MQHSHTSRFIPAAGYLVLIASLYTPVAAVVAVVLIVFCLFSSSALLRKQAKYQMLVVLVIEAYFALAIILTKLALLKALVVFGKLGFTVANLLGLYKLTTAK